VIFIFWIIRSAIAINQFTMRRVGSNPGSAPLSLRSHRGREHVNECVKCLVLFPQAINLRERMWNSRMVTAVVELTDFRKTPAAHVLRQVNRHLPAESVCCCISPDSSRSEILPNNLPDLRKGNCPHRTILVSGH